LPKIEKGAKSVKKTTYGASGTFEVKANKRLKVRSTSDNEDVFNDKCPKGKLWKVHIVLEIHEVDKP
jgi:hypothetical protein